MKTILFRIWQIIWGLPQTLLGFLIYLVNLRQPHEKYRGCIVTHWKQRGSMGLGMFLFLGENPCPETLVHEYGHSIQSMILGPLFLPVMGLPSFLWCNIPYFRKMRRDKGVSYYVFYPEKSADWLGSLATKTSIHR